jgi:hypothetical protein
MGIQDGIADGSVVLSSSPVIDFWQNFIVDAVSGLFCLLFIPACVEYIARNRTKSGAIVAALPQD